PFLFQAEDGIRDRNVTGVQTCALPILANFTLAVNRPFSNQQGNRDADFINCVVWRRQAENLANFMKKGSQVGVDGRLQTRTFEGQDGKTVFVTEVVADSVQFLESKG